MFAVFKRDLKSYFNSFTAYAFITFILFFVGILSVFLNYSRGNTAFSGVLSSLLFILAIAIPVLTMRSIADEKAQKTDKLLYSLPIKLYKVLLGKYFAALTVFTVPCAVMLLYPLILSAFGTVRFSNEYSSLLAFFLAGAVFIAIGIFVSCLTDNPITAVFASIAALMFICLIPKVTVFIPSSETASLILFIALAAILSLGVWLLTKNNYAGIFSFAILIIILLLVYVIEPSLFLNGFAKLLDSLSVYERFTEFVYGVFDLRTVFYFISLIVLFLFFGTQALEKKRWN